MAAGTVLMRHWGGETVVYHELSASTHLLEATAGALLQALADRAPGPGRDTTHGATVDELWCDAIGGDPLTPRDDNARLMLDEALQRLAQVGLAVAIDP